MDDIYDEVFFCLVGRTAAYDQLVAKRPTSSLASASNIFGISVHIFLVMSFQLFGFFYTSFQPWYILVALNFLDLIAVWTQCVCVCARARACMRVFLQVYSWMVRTCQHPTADFPWKAMVLKHWDYDGKIER